MTHHDALVLVSTSLVKRRVLQEQSKHRRVRGLVVAFAGPARWLDRARVSALHSINTAVVKRQIDYFLILIMEVNSARTWGEHPGGGVQIVRKATT